jgi:hypothetical protein
LAEYMFAAKCRAAAVDRFTLFAHVIRETDWSVTPAAASASLQPDPASHTTSAP